MQQLIINADDFGQAPGINLAIAELYDAGALTSATLMANGAAFEEAMALAKQRPGLGVGCHVVLLDGNPVLSPEMVPSLLGSDRLTFRPTLSLFVRDLAMGRIREEDIEREAVAQIRKLQQADLQVTHVDTHKHMHAFSRVRRPLLRAMEACGLDCLRNPFEEEWSMRLSAAPWLRQFQTRAMRYRSGRSFWNDAVAHTMAAPDACIGIAATGTLHSVTIERWLEVLPEGIWEIACHPGYRDTVLASQRTRLQSEREIELRALLETLPRILRQRRDIQPMHFGNLAAARVQRDGFSHSTC
ncbi:ChbG/HpnK family deacetylase [Terriglobus tenax]|uniref:ChbG/HpnK family deacetylase n=1 Tax=Terriglobus tenax TaxID=1111115 RepID=UPI0021E03045|nr:ChbG/HpnK family deacetylase [Terriglobus tenax]